MAANVFIKYIFAIRKLKFFDFHRDVAQPGSVLVWGARGRKFKSCHPDKHKSDLRKQITFLFHAAYKTKFCQAK